ncbi:type III secretion system protein SctP [Caldimonas brevitalea]|uniref:Type III secretion control protein HpaP n=1 Tax=Caldimonas brevitalea TaxID=413882 RepID=A0A0G3BKD1_9BURK|nr:type III secretion system protein SctP [Caldimonas brevitalea]AKJ27816.1 type III secretion control protein HpaP [Caldimonas brevitalea]
MTHSRVPIKSHKLQVPQDAGAARPPPAGHDKRLTFADLLRQRRSTASPPLPPASGSLEAAGEASAGASLDEDRPGLDALTDSDGSGSDSSDDHGRPDEQELSAELALQELAPVESSSAADRAASGEVGAATAVQWSRADERRVAYVVDTVARFCNDRAVANSDGWQVSMKLRPDVLPETVLHLGLSPHWLLLRFDIHDEQALALVFSHREQLVERLEAALDRRRDISITFS